MKKFVRSLWSIPSLVSILAVLFVILHPKELLAGGMSSFSESSPYGNRLYYDGSPGAPVTFNFSEKSKAGETASMKAAETAFSDFYFYKGFIVAETDTSYTIINEKNPEVLFFDNKASYDSYLDTHNLRPAVWTRWYNKNYDEANFKSIGFAAIFYFPISLFLIIIAIYSAISIRKTKNPLVKVLKKIYLITFIAISGVIFLLQAFPQSF
ncbi:MAG: hypothetical protein EOO88_02610 [Pedobacter sp.]|nr:MAG: hypothetical protein EOO88_02610 [Pedobacter sp.]